MLQVLLQSVYPTSQHVQLRLVVSQLLVLTVNRILILGSQLLKVIQSEKVKVSVRLDKFIWEKDQTTWVFVLNCNKNIITMRQKP